MIFIDHNTSINVFFLIIMKLIRNMYYCHLKEYTYIEDIGKK